MLTSDPWYEGTKLSIRQMAWKSIHIIWKAISRLPVCVESGISRLTIPKLIALSRYAPRVTTIFIRSAVPWVARLVIHGVSQGLAVAGISWASPKCVRVAKTWLAWSVISLGMSSKVKHSYKSTPIITISHKICAAAL